MLEIRNAADQCRLRRLSLGSSTGELIHIFAESFRESFQAKH